MRRAVRSLIRLIATGLMLFGVMEIGLQYVRHQLRKAEISLWHCLIGGLLIVLGAVVFAASSRLAAQLTDDFEE